MPRLEGKVSIITGAAAGIGEASARLFARKGARLVLVDRAAVVARLSEKLRKRSLGRVVNKLWSFVG